MRDDPGDLTRVSTITIPPSSGPGSGKDAWRALALRVIEMNESMQYIVDEQRAVIRDLKAEIELLRQQVEKRRPPGGKPRLSDDKVQRIESAVRRGETTRTIAKQFHVSHMTVARVAKRMQARDAAKA